jgi:hypothetical protein
MVKRTIIWTKTADLQLVGILEYWIKRNKSSSYSKKLFKEVIQRSYCRKLLSEQHKSLFLPRFIRKQILKIPESPLWAIKVFFTKISIQK